MYEKRFELVNVTSINATLHDKKTNEIKTWNVKHDLKKDLTQSCLSTTGELACISIS
jgi:hypothetical protein